MIRLMLSLAMALLLVPTAGAQLAAPSILSTRAEQTPPHPDSLLRWAATPGPEGVEFDFAIEPGWKLYAMDSPAGRPLAIAFDALPAGITLSGFDQSAPLEGYDPNFDMTVRYFEHRARVAARLEVPEGATPGLHVATGTVTFMLCSDVMCLPPRTKPFTVEVGAGGAALARTSTPDADSGGREDRAPAETAQALEPVEAAAPPDAGIDSSADRASAVPVRGGTGAGGLGAFLLLAFGAGLAALLTPCVFPLIPLTVATFSKGGSTRGAALRRALGFGAAIILVFTLLGAAASLVLGAAGAQQVAANPWVNVALGVAFVVFALALLGLIELRLPSRWVNAVDRASRKERGMGATLLAALAIALVSFSCTAPFVGGLLATAATGGWMRPLLGMGAFSTAFALPFIALAAAPGLLERLPRSGGWMLTFKGALGFVELAAALKFLSNADLVWGLGLLTRPVVIALTMAVAALLALYLLGAFRLRPEAGAAAVPVGAGRLLGALAAAGAFLLLWPGLSGGRVPLFDAYLPPATGSVAAAESEASPWFTDDLDGARAEAVRIGKPLFVDFTGYTCTNCRAMEANVFPAPAVAPLLSEDFVRVRLYTDGRPNGPSFQTIQQEMTGTLAMPTYAVLSPEGEVVGVWSGMASPEDFASFLRETTARAS